MKRHHFLIPIVIIFVAVLGAVFTSDGMVWYETLVRPRIAPPNEVFAPVWTLLYALIALALLLYVDRRPMSRQFEDTISLFILSGILNVLWSLAFFRWHALGWAVIDAGLIALTAWMLAGLVWPFSRLAAIFLWPYAIWTSFATVLAYSFWLLN